MPRFDLSKNQKIVFEEQALTLAAGNAIAHNGPKLGRVLVNEFADGRKLPMKSTSRQQSATPGSVQRSASGA